MLLYGEVLLVTCFTILDYILMTLVFHNLILVLNQFKPQNKKPNFLMFPKNYQEHQEHQEHDTTEC